MNLKTRLATKPTTKISEHVGMNQKMADGRNYGVFDSETGKCKLADVSKDEAEKKARELNANRSGAGEWYAEPMSDSDHKITESAFGPKYFMVDHEKTGKQQILDAGEVSASYTWWINQGSMNGCNYMSDDVLDSLNNLFNNADERRVTAFFKQEQYQISPDRLSSMPPTSITGGGVDLSGFRILDESVESTSSTTFTTHDQADAVMSKLKAKYPSQPWSVQKKAGRWYIANPDMSRADMRRNIKALKEGATYSPDVGWIGGASDEGDHHIDPRTGRNERSPSYYKSPRGRMPSVPKTDYTVAIKIPFGRKDEFKELLKGKYRWDNNERTWMISKTDLNDQVRDQIKNMGGEVLRESSPVPGMSAAQYSKEEGYDWLEKGMKHRDRIESPRVGDTVTVDGKRGKLVAVDKRRIATGAMGTFYRIKPNNGAEYSVRKGHSNVKAVMEDGSTFNKQAQQAHAYRITNMKNKQQVDVRAPNADQAVMMAIKQAGQSFFSFPIVIQNLDIHQMVHINSDAEYDSKIQRVDQASSMELSLESRKAAVTYSLYPDMDENGSSLIQEMPDVTDKMIAKKFGRQTLEHSLQFLEYDENKGTVGFGVKSSDGAIYRLYKNYGVWRIGGWKYGDHRDVFGKRKDGHSKDPTGLWEYILSK